MGNLKTVKNGREKTKTCTYDDADRPTRVDYPDATYEAWTYRDDGRIASHRDGRGRVTDYRYDADDRVWGPAGSGYVAINYPNDTDVNISRDKDGLVTSFADASGTTAVSWYPSGWVKSVQNGYGKKVEYEHNGVGDLSKLWAARSPDKWFTYAYNARNQTTSVTDQNGTTLSSFGYDGGGRRTTITRPGSYIEYSYNARDWLTAVLNRTTGGATLYDARYYYQDGTLWDQTGNPVKRTEDFGSGLYPTTLRYDKVYRQTEETRRNPGGTVDYTITYGYDAAGNRTTRVKDGVTVTYTYDDNDKMTAASGGGQTASFGYDGAGSMTSASGTMYGAWALVYDDQSRPTSITYPSGGGSVTDLFTYNAIGQRMRARLGGTWGRYFYNGERVLEETNDANGTLARYTTESGSYYEPLLHFGRNDGSVRYPLYDGIGTVRRLADQTGALTDSYTLDTFGRQISVTGTTPNPYRFGGAWGYITDPSGMLQLGARFYWPEVGRFVQQDPVGEGANWYGYAEGNPVVGIDPTGLGILQTIGGILSGSGQPRCVTPFSEASCKKQYEKALRRCKSQLRMAKVGAFVVAMGREMSQSRGNCGSQGSEMPEVKIEDPNATGDQYYDLVKKAEVVHKECVKKAKEEYQRCRSRSGGGGGGGAR